MNLKKNVLTITDRVLRLLNPTPPVGGLSISDGALRFLSIKDKTTLVTSSLRLPPGIVSEGLVVDPKALRSALADLHGQIAPAGELVHAVLLLPPGLAHAQVFSIPSLADKRLEEAARLNLQMISPIEFSTAYSGWERVGTSTATDGQIDLLGAFAEAQSVDTLTQALADTGFSVVAVEFPALALARLLRRSAAMVDGSDAFLSVEVTPDGVSLMILRNLDLYFTHFHSWNAVRGELNHRDITREDIAAFLVKEVRKLLNFYASKWGGSIGSVVLFASTLRAELTTTIEKTFSLPVKPLTLKDFPNLDPLWLPALGAALRGAYPRSLDKFLSLTNSPVQVQYARARTLQFISLWAKIAIAVTAMVAVAAVGVDSLLARTGAAAKQQQIALSPEQISRMTSLEASARSFNASAALLKTAAASVPRSVSFFTKITELMSTYNVKMTSFSLGKTEGALSGSAPSEAALFGFRDALAKVKGVSGINLPVDAITYLTDGSANFSVRFTRSTP